MFSNQSFNRRVIDGLSVESFPLTKPQFDEIWICRLQQGEISVNFNQVIQNVDASQKTETFIVTDCFPFAIESGSKDFKLEVITIGQDCLNMVYPHLGSEVNSTMEYSRLILSSEMKEPLSTMVSYAFNLLWTISDYTDKDIMERKRFIIHQLASCIMLFHNGIVEKQKTEPVKGKSTQSFRIMSQLEKLFHEEESFRHREASFFADKLNISTRYFYNVCMKETGMSSKDFINEVIISEIKNRILLTSHSFQQICQEFAFPDQTAFTQYFKRNTGMTPTEYRKKYK